MSFLRSSLFIAIVSVLVLTGYGCDLLGDCCSHSEVTQAEHGNMSPKGQMQGDADGCQCICHQVVTPLTLEPARVGMSIPVSGRFAAQPDEFPPDAVPLGIDYPPQLA